MEGVEAALDQLAAELLFHGALEPGIGRAHAVRAGLLDDGDVDQQVVTAEPVLDQPLGSLLPAGGEFWYSPQKTTDTSTNLGPTSPLLTDMNDWSPGYGRYIRSTG